jgi:cytochrome P450
LFPSANRDESVFETAERFDITRHPNPHLAFGAGPHFCLGAAIARLELRVLLPLAFERLHGLELAGSPERLRSNFLSGYSRMPVRFTLAPPSRSEPGAP